MSLFLAWAKFLVLLALIYIFGVKASKSADIIAEKKRWAKAFMGVIFISMITSFPELFTGISSVVLKDSPDFAVGEILGSCIFNLLIIAVIEIFFRKNNIYQLRGKINILPLAFGFILINILTVGISLKINLHFLNVGFFSLVIIVCYLIFLRIIFNEKQGSPRGRQAYKKESLKREVIRFAISAVIIIAVGILLPVVGDEIAREMGWNHSFVGVIFLALVTSFPELVVSFTIARMGAFDMLLGNISGSNMFNLGIIFIVDVFYFKGIILNNVSISLVSVGLVALMMNFIVFFAVVRRSSFKLLNLVSINAIILVLLYIANLFISQ
jgi:cation:H+ antiporter